MNKIDDILKDYINKLTSKEEDLIKNIIKQNGLPLQSELYEIHTTESIKHLWYKSCQEESKLLLTIYPPESVHNINGREMNFEIKLKYKIW